MLPPITTRMNWEWCVQAKSNHHYRWMYHSWSGCSETMCMDLIHPTWFDFCRAFPTMRVLKCWMLTQHSYCIMRVPLEAMNWSCRCYRHAVYRTKQIPMEELHWHSMLPVPIPLLKWFMSWPRQIGQHWQCWILTECHRCRWIKRTCWLSTCALLNSAAGWLRQRLHRYCVIIECWTDGRLNALIVMRNLELIKYIQLFHQHMMDAVANRY